MLAEKKKLVGNLLYDCILLCAIVGINIINLLEMFLFL